MTHSLKSLSDQARALKEQGRLDEAIDLFARAARAYPQSAVAEHNLASVLGDAGRAEEAEKHIRRAFRKGLDAPESWLVLARALLAQARLGEAHEAFAHTIQLNPGMLDAQYEFAQLIWMTSGDSAAALAPIEATIRAYPGMRDIYATKAQVLMYTAGAEAAFAFAKSSLQKLPDDVRLLRLGVDAATMSDEPQAALDFSERLLRLQPDAQSARVFRAYALLAAGRASEVLPIAEALCDANPDDQHALGLLAITWRLLGDGRYQELYDYEQFVRPYKLATPEGWDTLEEYLVDLGSALRAHHPFKTHPFSNSEENGSKIADVLEIDDPAIKAFRQALTPPVSEHLRYLGTGDDALRRRNTGDWSIDGIWSVWLQPNGFHHNHVHPAGWLSSACYIELPHRIDAGEHEGWIKFGEPGPVTHPKLPPEHLVKPEPGLLVLFPSYMWHGTVPFGGDEPRLTIALDIVPG